MRRRWPAREVVRGYVLLPHLTPILAVMTATAVFAFIASGGWPGGADLVMLLLAMLGGQVAIGATNELVDVELDRQAKPSKPIPSGLVSERGARVMAASGVVLMVLGSTRFSLPAFGLCALGTGLGVAYSLWFKRTPWSWVPYVLAIPLLPLWVWMALGSVPAALLAVYPAAIPGLVALQLAQSIPDIDADRDVGVRTLAVVLGARLARLSTWWLVGAMAAIAAVLAVLTLERSVFVVAAGVGALVLAVLHGRMHDADAGRARMRLFPLVALAVGIIGVGWALDMAASRR